MDKDLMRGSIDILLLSVIAKKDTYGYEIVKDLKETSQELYNMSEGTLYPALKRLEKKNWVESYWGESNAGGRRKYYKITQIGKEELETKVSEWNQVNQLIKKNLEGIAWQKGLKPM